MPRPTTIVRLPPPSAQTPAGAAATEGLPAAVVDAALNDLLAELETPSGFPAEVEEDARRSAREPALPGTDWTDVGFVTIDPPGSVDLDQAVHLERRGAGYRVRYAIADVPAFVRPGSPVDAEARRRGQTLYAPHTRVPLHPAVLSEDAASLLPGQVRPAFVWVVDLDSDGEVVAVDVVRALVRSRVQLTYAEVQAACDEGRLDGALAELPRIGALLIALEAARGGSGIAVPDQEVVPVPGGYELRYRPVVPVEDWNAQISLLTGMAAADVMLAGGVGILRTMPAPDDRTLARFHRQAAALGHPWPAELSYGHFLRGLDPAEPSQLALLHASTSLFRGAGYTPFDGAAPEQVVQAAVAAEYAHVTAPLRRLVDRFGLVVCEALCRGAEVPAWVRQALPTLPGAMSDSDRRAGALERASIGLAEALALASRVGETFSAVVVDVEERAREDGREQGLVQLREPAVLARCSGALVLGAEVRVRLEEADPVGRRVTFALAEPPA